MVLAVLAVVIGAMVPTLLSFRVAEQARTTAQNLKTVMNTIAAFVQSSGCVPCPVPAERALSEWRGLVGAGREDYEACGVCNTTVGLVPFRSLGLPEAFAKDAYGHWLTYAVDTTLAGYRVSPKVQPVGDKGLCGETYSAASEVPVELDGGSTQNGISVMLLSHGANGYGAYKNQPTDNNDRFQFPTSARPCIATEGAERCNAGEGSPKKFIAKTASQGTDPFDDVYLYLDRNALVAYLGNQPCSKEWK